MLYLAIRGGFTQGPVCQVPSPGESPTCAKHATDRESSQSTTMFLFGTSRRYGEQIHVVLHREHREHCGTIETLEGAQRRTKRATEMGNQNEAQTHDQ